MVNTIVKGMIPKTLNFTQNPSEKLRQTISFRRARKRKNRIQR